MVDINQKRIDAWQTDKLPIYEPGLLEVVKKARGRNLFFSTDDRRGHPRSGYHLRVGEHADQDIRGGGRQGRGSAVLGKDRAQHRQRHPPADKIIIEKSTLPVRTADAMERILNANEKGIHFEIALQPGVPGRRQRPCEDLLKPDRVLIGSRETPEGIKARREMVDIYAHWVPPTGS